jgi:hypothetical protein
MAGRQSHRLASDLHRLPRSLERRGEKRLIRLKLVDLGPDQAPQRSADRPGLLAPTRVERRVELSLQAVLGVISRLAVAHEDKAMRKLRHLETIPLEQLNPALRRRAPAAGIPIASPAQGIR